MGQMKLYIKNRVKLQGLEFHDLFTKDIANIQNKNHKELNLVSCNVYKIYLL